MIKNNVFTEQMSAFDFSNNDLAHWMVLLPSIVIAISIAPSLLMHWPFMEPKGYILNETRITLIHKLVLKVSQ